MKKKLSAVASAKDYWKYLVIQLCCRYTQVLKYKGVYVSKALR